MCRPLIIECRTCDGERGWGVLTGGYDRHDGSPLGYWEPCPICRATGEEEIEGELIDEADLEIPPHTESQIDWAGATL
jgi:hypothetical protein